MAKANNTEQPSGQATGGGDPVAGLAQNASGSFLHALRWGLLIGLRFLLGRRFIKMNFRLLSQLATTNNVLRVLGAEVGNHTHIYSDICVYNLHQGSCRNLKIGSKVYIGPRCVFDLSSPIMIENEVSVSAQVTFITHLDVGTGQLKKLVSRADGPITVKRGAWIGVNTTVLHGVTIGEHSMVGAMSLVNHSVPAGSLALGSPCRVVRQLGEVSSHCASVNVSHQPSSIQSQL